MYVGTRIIAPHQNLNSCFANLLEFYLWLTFGQLHHFEDSKLLTLGKAHLFPSDNHRYLFILKSCYFNMFASSAHQGLAWVKGI